MEEQRNIYEIVEHLATLDEGNTWTLELNRVRINGGDETLHIGKWLKGGRQHKRFAGALTDDAAKKLYEALAKIYAEA